MSSHAAARTQAVDFDAYEAARLEALDRFDVLGTPPEPGFDGIVRLIRNIFRVPIGLVSVLDGHRQWMKACEGLTDSEYPRSETFCDTVIRTGKPLVIEDTRADARFKNNRYVVDAPYIRFYAGVPLRTRDGYDLGTLCALDYAPRKFGAEQLEILADLARVAMAEMELRQLVAVDALTGVLSRRAFKEEANRAVALARRHELDIACIVFDIDHFKGINDEHGHAAGDAVLAAVAGACKGLLRKTDDIGRLGGEEFAIVLPHTDRKGAVDAAEKLRHAIEALKVPTDAGPVDVTCSFGVAALDTEAEDIDTLLVRADAALYEAKRAGRNMTRSWQGADAVKHSPRRRVLKAGTIHFNNRMSSVDCTVRFLSDDGAGLDLSSSYGLPEKFALLVRSDGLDKPCRIVAQSERHVEVEFT